MLGFSQNDLIFNKVRNIFLAAGQTATVPTGKVWKIESAIPPMIYLVHDGDDDFGTGSDGGNAFASLDASGISGGSGYSGSNAVWIEEGNAITTYSATTTQTLSILEFNVVAASSSTDGSGGDSGSGTNSSSGSSGSSFSNNAGTPSDDFTDSDGVTYGTTNINGMIWTTSNYNGATYSDGTIIPYISDYEEWKFTTTGAYTYWIQDSSLGYGKIYNLHAIRGRHDDDNLTPNKTFAPEGWHVPSKTEFAYIQTLYDTNYAVNSYSLKSQTEWISGTNGNNFSGLDFKPYGLFLSNVEYGTSYNEEWGFTNTNLITGAGAPAYYINFSIGGGTSFWSSTPHTNLPFYNQFTFQVLYGETSLYSGYGADSHLNLAVNSSHSGSYVRLIKDY